MPMTESTMLAAMGIQLAPGKRFLSLRERRKLGIIYRNIKRILVEMKTEDPAALKQPTGALAEEVFGRIVDENLQAFGGIIDWENIDWDAVWAFIEKIIEMIMKFIALI